MRRPEQIDNSLLALVRELAPVSRKTLLDAYRRYYSDDARTMRSLEQHLAQLVASGALERIGIPPASRYRIGQKELERQRANGKHAPAQIEVDDRPLALIAHTIERPDVSQHATLVDRAEQESTTTTTDAQASSEVVARQASTQVEQLVDQVLALVVEHLRPALVEVVEAQLVQLSADCDEALRIAEQAQADLAAYRQRVRSALLSEE